MKLAFIVQGHKNPAQIARLARRLACEEARVYVHVSAVSSGLDRAVRSQLRNTRNVEFVDSKPMYWNSWTFVRAIMRSLRQALDSGYPFDYVVLLTGQDYPILGKSAMAAHFERARGKSFLLHDKLPLAEWESGGLDRFRNLHLVVPTHLPGREPLRMTLKPIRERCLPSGFELWGGGGYWGLSRNHVLHLVRTVDDTPQLERLFRYCAVPDELFFHTVLLSTLPQSEFIRQSTSFVVWDRPTGPWPAILKTSDFQRVVSSGHPLARKFDVTVDEGILDMLDERAGEARPSI